MKAILDEERCRIVVTIHLGSRQQLQFELAAATLDIEREVIGRRDKCQPQVRVMEPTGYYNVKIRGRAI